MRLTRINMLVYLLLGIVISSCSRKLSDRYLVDSLNKRDGRYSIGADNENLTYSWYTDTATWATSHFVVGVDKLYASNYPLSDTSSKEDLSSYLRGQNNIYRKGSYTISETDYRFMGVDIVQKLTPVKKNLKDLKRRNDYAQYYKVSYELVNTTGETKSVAFRLLFDTQLQTNDSCIVQPLTAKGLKKLFGLFRKNPELDNKSYTFTNKNIPKKITMHESEDWDVQNLIGGLRPCVKGYDHPDELVIGDWNRMTSDVWSVRNKPKYGDSGISMRWFRKTLAPNDTLKYTVFYGLHLPAWGRRVFRKERKPNESLMLEFQGRTDYLMDTYLTAGRDTIEVGDSVFVSWNIHHTDCYPDSLTNLITNVDSLHLYDGMYGLRPLRGDSYWMSLQVEKSKVRAFFHDSVYVNYTPGKNYGRFTMGADEEDLLFGYPFDLSTSHIVVSVLDPEGQIADRDGMALPNKMGVMNRETRFYTNALELQTGESNSEIPKRQFKAPKLMTGKLDTLVREGSGSYKIIYPAEDTSLYIIQRLTAYNKNYEPVQAGEVGQYYQLQYDIGNASDDAKYVGLGLVLDPRVAGSEKGWMLVDSIEHWVQKDTVLKPEELYVFTDELDTLRMAHANYSVNDATPPDMVYNTLWQSIRTDVVGRETSLEIPNDRALFSQWQPELLDPYSWKRYTMYLGNPQAESVNLKFHRKHYADLELWYDLDADTLIQGEINALQKFYKAALARKKNKEGEWYIPYTHIVVEGFTGSLGSPEYNFDLANRRIEHVRMLLGKLGIKAEVILNKIDGEYYANPEPSRQKERNNERMVWIKVY